MKHSVILLFLAFMAILPAKGESLSAKERHIAGIAAFTASGNMDRLGETINSGLDSCLSINEIKEIMVQMYAYCGFPRSLNALNLLMNTVEERNAAGKHDTVGAEASPVDTIADMSAHGEEIRTALVGRPVTGKVYEFCPVIDDFLRSHLFGDIFARDNISYQYRELATASALAAMNLEAQLRSHLGICRNLGYSEGQLRDLAGVISRNIGVENGETVSRVIDIIFN